MRFGDEVADVLVPKVLALADEFNESDARVSASTLAEMGEWAAARFRLLHPELSEAAVLALAWCYTFDNR